MKKNILILFVLFFSSCNQNTIYDGFKTDFTANRWLFNEEQTYEFKILEDGIYAIDLHLGHVYGFQFATVPLEVVFLNEEKIILQKTIQLLIKNKKGEDLANCSGDICDLYQNLEKKRNLKKGTYRIKVTNKFPSAYLPNVLGFGIKVTKTDLK